jgi:acetate kinase
MPAVRITGDAILSVNSGSSTLKFALYPLDASGVQPACLTGLAEELEEGGTPSIAWVVNDESHRVMLACGNRDPFDVAMDRLIFLVTGEVHSARLRAVAHRVVHGGEQFRHSVRVDDAVFRHLEQLKPLAPLHQPHNLAGLARFRALLPGVPQVACFDTAFHATIPEREYRFALPESLLQEGIRRYGFHGLSYQFVRDCMKALSRKGLGRLLMAHLGNGASLCAALNGQSLATTMGFSTLDGLMMGTRSGAMDPGVLLYLLKRGWSTEKLETLLYHQSGLLGVSGLTSDMRQLRASDAPAARLAIELFTWRVVREAGALTACLGGLDVLAFTGGIGEHDHALRADVCRQLGFLGIRLDAGKNAGARGEAITPVHASDSAVEVWVVPADEGQVAAREALGLI